MSPRTTFLVAMTAALLLPAASGAAQPPTPPFDRLPSHVFDAIPPAAHVSGEPGQMTPRPRACRSLPIADARQRIVELAVQEWGYFGFPVVEYNADDDEPNAGSGRIGGSGGRGGGAGRGRGRGPSRVGTPAVIGPSRPAAPGFSRTRISTGATPFPASRAGGFRGRLRSSRG
jgi:hypothetical protein